MIGKIKTKERRSKYFNEPHIDLFQPNPLVRYYQLINDSADDRSKIIMINLVLENQVDSLLKYLIYGYTENLEARMNYNMKLILLDSFNLLPDAIFTAANCLRVIRNEFAHNLNIANYDSLPSDIIKNIKSSFQIVAFEVEKKEANSIEKQIKSILFAAMVGFYSYEPNIRALQEQIDSQAFKDNLLSKFKAQLKEQWDIVSEIGRKQNASK